MNPRNILICLAATAALFTSRPVTAGMTKPSPGPSPAAEAELPAATPPSVLPYLLRAKNATVWRMGMVENPDPRRPGRLSRLGNPVVLNEEQLRRLQEVLRNPANLGSGVHLCLFQPIVAVVFEGEGFSLELQFCFACEDVEVSLDGRYVKTVPIDPGRAAYLGFFKEIFPTDKRLQSLPLQPGDASGDGEKKTK